MSGDIQASKPPHVQRALPGTMIKMLKLNMDLNSGFLCDNYSAFITDS